jgi:hypothetical protein
MLQSSSSTKNISTFSVRGRLGSTIVLFFTVGLLMSYAFGAIFPYFVVPWISIPFSVIFLVGFYHVPETPLYLLRTKKYDVSWKMWWMAVEELV